MRTGLTKKQKVTEVFYNAKAPTAEIHTHDTKLKKQLHLLSRISIINISKRNGVENMIKRFISTFLTIALLITMLPELGVYVQAATIDSGSCGGSVTWTLDSDGTLIISGTGEMPDYSSTSGKGAPWESKRDQITKVIIEDGITYVGRACFYRCANLTDVTVPNSVTKFGASVFMGCNNLESFVFPQKLKEVRASMFENCSKLNNIVIPSGVESIGYSAFRNCVGLTNITIPASITTIDSYAFSSCESLQDVYYAGTEQQWDIISIDIFNDVLENVAMHFQFSDIGTDNDFPYLYTVKEIEQLVADYYNENMSDDEYPGEGTYVVFSSETYINDSMCSVVVRFQGTNATAANIFIADVTIDMSTGEMFIWDVSQGFLWEQSGQNIDDSNAIANSYSEMLSQGTYVQYVQENAYNYEYTVENGGMAYNFALVDIDQDGRQELIVDAMDILGWFADLVFTQSDDDSVIFCGSLWTYSPVEYSAEYSALSYISSRPAFGEVPYAYIKLSETGIIDYSIEEYDDSFQQLDWMTLDEMLSYLQSISVEDEIIEDYARTKWINKHIEYANSDQYKTQVVQGFSGALDDALEDIKGNGMITAYNTLDSINTILDFDLDLTDVEEYELLLAQILFSRTGTTSINEIYDEYLSNNIITICEILIENIPEMTSSEINEKVEKLKELLNTIKGLSRGDTQYNEVLSQIMDSISSFDDLNFGKEFVEAFDKAGLSFAADFVVSEIDTVENTLSEVIVYMAAGEAYCNTSDAFGDMILALRKHIAIPSDNPIFEPYQSDKMLVNDQMIWTKLGLKNAGNSIGPDPLNTPIYLSALAKAIENYYTQLEAAKAGNASVIAQNAMAEFATKTADNLIDAELNVVVSLFECLPVVKQFSAIKALFDGTQFVIDTFTGIDDRAYLGTMVMRLYSIAYIHYLSVDNLATHTDAWGTITTFSPIEQKFDANAQFADAAQFDEAVAVYRAILSVATDYAEEYYATYYEAADSILSKYPNYKPTIPPYVDTDSDTFKSVKQKIIELQMQKNDLAYEWCHSSKIIFNQLHGVNTYDSSEMLIYSFKCPVSVTFKNESGEIIATLSNGNSTVSAGYEQYFFTSEVISGSGEYVKIAAVPQSYEVVIEGTGTGRMDVSVSEYNDGQLGETKQYFGVPVSEDSSGYFGVKDEDGEDFCLIMDDTAYAEGDYSNIELDDGNKMTLYIAIVAIGVVCVGLAVIILKRKKSPK